MTGAAITSQPAEHGNHVPLETGNFLDSLAGKPLGNRFLGFLGMRRGKAGHKQDCQAGWQETKRASHRMNSGLRVAGEKAERPLFPCEMIYLSTNYAVLPVRFQW
jgi:hypothetical protein